MFATRHLQRGRRLLHHQHVIPTCPGDFLPLLPLVLLQRRGSARGTSAHCTSTRLKRWHVGGVDRVGRLFSGARRSQQRASGEGRGEAKRGRREGTRSTCSSDSILTTSDCSSFSNVAASSTAERSRFVSERPALGRNAANVKKEKGRGERKRRKEEEKGRGERKRSCSALSAYGQHCKQLGASAANRQSSCCGLALAGRPKPVLEGVDAIDRRPEVLAVAGW